LGLLMLVAGVSVLTRAILSRHRQAIAVSAAGLAATPVDMLICAISLRLHLPVFTSDADFSRYAQMLPLRLPTSQQIAAAIREIKGDKN